MKIIEFNKCHSVSEVAVIKDEQKGILSSILSQTKVVFDLFFQLNKQIL